MTIVNPPHLSISTEPGANSDGVLARASKMLKEQHQIMQTTLQVEGYQEVMDDCHTCQEAERTGVLHGLIPGFLRKKMGAGFV